MNNPQDQEEENTCEYCDGTGMRKYSASYIDGDLYQDGEVLECGDCQGTGKIKTNIYGEDKRN